MTSKKVLFVASGLLLVIVIFSFSGRAQNPTEASVKEKAISAQISSLRNLTDDVRARVTKQLALDIRQLPVSIKKLSFASALANLATEGDFGRDTLQEVATTLAQALREQPSPMNGDQPSFPYVQLAQLARYEKIAISSDDSQFLAGLKKLEGDDEARRHADFTLSDIDGRSWTLRSLRGKVVLLNFWATWCPPCRKEMPDLEILYKRFREKGLVVLAISDEDVGKVKPFAMEQKLSFPMLLDLGRKVSEAFRVNGIPKTFIYDRDGRLAAQSIDMRTQKQFLELLSQAGLK